MTPEIQLPDDAARRVAPESARRMLSVLCISTLFPNAEQQTHGIFVETRLRKLLASGEARAKVVAPIAWLPPLMRYKGLGATRKIARRETRNGIEVEHPRYIVVPKVGMSAAPFTLYRTLRRTYDELVSRGERFDVIDAHYFYPDGVAAVWLATKVGLPVVVTARGTDINLIPRFQLPRRLIQNAAAKADGIVAVCGALKDALSNLKVPTDRILVLRNGVDLETFRPLEREDIRKELALTRRTLASVGHLIERKGHHHVIRALARLPDTDLVIVGNGPERQALEDLSVQMGVRDRVRFIGVVEQSRLCRIYNAVDALVLASSREGWANVLLESMACGTPVVASAVWGTPEVVASQEAGVLMETLDDSGVVSGVQRLFAALPDRILTRRYAERFDWGPTTRGQLELFREIVARRGANADRTPSPSSSS